MVEFTDILLLWGAGMVAAVVLLGVAVGYAKATKRSRAPKGYTKFTPQPQPRRTNPKDAAVDAYKPKKIPAEVDYVVIGSGIGGLYCAGLLARCGKTVVVLEQHYVAGGCTHEFKDKGYTYDTGVHYVGRIDKYGPLLDLVSDPDHKVQWSRIGTKKDGFAYDEIALETKDGEQLRVPLPSGRQQYIDAIAKHFPEERAAIERWVELCEKANDSSEIHFFAKLFPTWLERLAGRFLGGEFAVHATRTLTDVLDSLTSNKKLRALLAGQFGDYGLPPSEAPFFVHAGIVAHYLEGGYYPVGGTGAIARAIIPVIERAGGRVLVKAEVAGIVVRPGTNRASGVRMADDTEIPARCGVISSAGAINTYHRLVPESMRAKVLKQLPAIVQKPVETGISHMYCFIGFNGTSEELGLVGRNLWRLPVPDSYDIDEMCKDHYSDPFSKERELLLFVGFPSAKDPTFTESHPGKSNCIIITEAKPEWFDPEKNGGLSSGKRTAEYEKLKESFKERLVSGLLKYFPQLEGKIDYCDIASPLTNEYYLKRSASYGLPMSRERFMNNGAGGLRPQSPIDGLWLTGQDVLCNGYVAALLAGVVTAHSVLGYNAVDLMMLGRNLVSDMQNLPPAERAPEKKR